jgi:hypothetical protein
MAQSLVFFSLEALQHLDGGKAAIAFRRAVDDCVRDCQDRPLDDKARKVTLELSITPVAEEDPEFDNSYRASSVEGQFKIATTLPKRQTKPYSFGIDAKGRMFFSRTSPDNVQQSTFEDLDDSGHANRGEPGEAQA